MKPPRYITLGFPQCSNSDVRLLQNYHRNYFLYLPACMPDQSSPIITNVLEPSIFTEGFYCF